MSKYDVVFLGSSPDALVAAANLARARQKVLVLEQSAWVGGAVSTTEFAPGFKGDTSLTSGRITATVAKDLKLAQHGLEVIERETISSLLPDERSFTLPADRDAAVEVIKRFAPEDASKYKPFMQLIDLAADFLQAAYSITPPPRHNSQQASTVDSAKELTSLVSRLRGYGRREMTEVMRLLVMPVRDLLDEWFQSPELKGLIAGIGIRGLTQGPFAGGTTFNLLHHIAIGDGLFRASAKGGIGAVSNALAGAAKAHGAELRINSTVTEIIVTGGVATGVKLASGETIEAGKVVSGFDVRRTFKSLVSPVDLEPEFNRRVNNVRYNGAVARVDLALNDLPNFTGLSPESLRGTVVYSPSIAHVEKAFDAAKRSALSQQPYLELSVPTLSDSSLAPSGKHVLSVWLQYAPYRSKANDQQVLESVLSTLSQFAPNLRSITAHSRVLTPQSFEQQFQLTEGHLYGADMTLAQAFFLRPVPGCAQYASPIEGLYLCGFASHPGGGLSGLGGVNVANELGLKSLALPV